MQCVILAGGLGTRMRPHTEKAPKTLLPVGDVPFAHFQLNWLARHGVTEVVYCIGHLGEQVRDFVGDGSRWGLAADYVEDGPELAGTAGALRRAFDAGALHDWFLVLYGDSFLPFDFRRLTHAFLEQTRPALMTVYRNQGRWEAGNVRYASGVVRLYQKARKGEQPLSGMDYIDYGVSAFRREVIAESVGRGEKKDLSDVCHRLSVEGQLAGMEVAERFYEIGSPAGMQDFEAWTVQHPEAAWASR
ncbi:MAG TPA: sugar phosphate nucleotidyltransferase [Gemmataceae bacterium]|nr:sugar phosphate nucleotidyltransferase [Gemmataceae bacterium]